MLIALDYDGTYTEDWELWRMFIKSAHKKGHEVVIVTMRHDVCDEGTRVVNDIGDLFQIFFKSRKSKSIFIL